MLGAAHSVAALADAAVEGAGGGGRFGAGGESAGMQMDAMMEQEMAVAAAGVRPD